MKIRPGGSPPKWVRSNSVLKYAFLVHSSDQYNYFHMTLKIHTKPLIPVRLGILPRAKIIQAVNF